MWRVTADHTDNNCVGEGEGTSRDLRDAVLIPSDTPARYKLFDGDGTLLYEVEGCGTVQELQDGLSGEPTETDRFLEWCREHGVKQIECSESAEDWGQYLALRGLRPL
jgi:hypothetical protein